MELPGQLALVFVAGLVTCLATGLGAVPYFVVDEVSTRWNVRLWGLASGIMFAASGFGLIREGLAHSTGLPGLLGLGLVAGVVLVVVADWALDRASVGGEAGHDHGHGDGDGHGHGDGDDHDHHVDPEAIATGDVKQLVLILGVLTVHSFPEGVAVGVSFARMGLDGGVDVPVLGLTVPLLAVVMTVSISVHNVPEGLAISIPLKHLGVSKWRMVGAAVFSSLPQPIGAVVAFAFVRWAEGFLPFGFGFAAGAMVFLVVTEFIPEGLAEGESLPHGGRRELGVGVGAGLLVMLPLLFV